MPHTYILEVPLSQRGDDMLECNPNGLSSLMGIILATGVMSPCPKCQAQNDLWRILHSPTEDRKSDEDYRALRFLRETADKGIHR